MAIFEDRFIKGSRFTQHFTLDDPSDQVVPKAGTDTVPGALALNLGNNLPADTTNATDALTAAGFNAMANQVDTTDPFCGNAVQQAVTVAVGQSIACDTDAQEAIACAIASNPEAVACLQAVLCGSTTSGKYYVATSSQADYDGNTNLVGNCYMVNNGVSTLLTPSGLSTYWQLNDVNKDNPVAYYKNGSSLTDRKVSQITMTDTGVTEVLYDLSGAVPFPPQVTQNFMQLYGRIMYDTVTKNAYCNFSLSGNDDDGAAYTNNGLLKLTLNPSGLIVSTSPVAQAPTVELLANGKALLGGGSGMLDLTTLVITPFAITGFQGSYRGFDISPDGNKWAHSGSIDGYGGTVFIRSSVDGSVICITNQNKPMDSYLNGGAFFTQDSNHIVVAGDRPLPGGVGTPQTGAGHLLYSAATGALIPNGVGMYSTFTSSGAETIDYCQSYADNNAICTVSIIYGAIGQVRILENINDVWQEIAMLPGIYNRAGFYLVSA